MASLLGNLIPEGPSQPRVCLVHRRQSCMRAVLPAVSFLGIMPHVGKHAQNTNTPVPQ